MKGEVKHMEKPVFIKVSNDIMIVCKKNLALAMADFDTKIQLQIGKTVARFLCVIILSQGGKNGAVLSEIEKWITKVELEAKEEFDL